MMKKIFCGLLCLCWIQGILAAKPTASAQPLTPQEFINVMVRENHFNRYELMQLFAHTEYLPEVIDRINKPFEEKPWDFYRNFFITPDRISGGVQYWHDHAKTLAKASKQYGVPPAVIIAIIGIETKYGHETGAFPELRTLATLSFHYPKRAAFFQSELANYLLLTREYNLSPAEFYGSTLARWAFRNLCPAVTGSLRLAMMESPASIY